MLTQAVHWTELAREIGPGFAARAADHDENDAFVADNYTVLKENKVFSAMVPITGLSVLTAIIPLVLYTILIFVRNIVAGFDAVPLDVEEAADGMGYTRRQRLRAVDLPLALPLIVAGVRVASVSTIGLVTITGALGDRFGGLGFFIFEGYRRSFPTEILFGAIPAMVLAIAVDLSLVAVQGRLTPWSHIQADAGMSALDPVTPDAPAGAVA